MLAGTVVAFHAAAMASMALQAFANPEPCRITEGSGAPVTRDGRSTLERLTVTVHDSAPGAKIDGEAPIGIRETGGVHRYAANWTIRAQADLRAVETRFLLFDIWNEQTQMLKSAKILDMPPGSAHVFRAEWPIPDENEAAEHYASVAYIARTRTADGHIFTGDTACVLDGVQRIDPTVRQ